MPIAVRVKCGFINEAVVLFVLIGVITEISSKGIEILGGFYFMLIGMFIYQIIMFMNVSDYVQTSVMKRKLSTGLPAFVSTIIYLLLMTVLVVEKYVLIRMYPDIDDQYLDVLCMIIVLLFFTMVYRKILPCFILGWRHRCHR